jgi:hypothetical protein
MVAEMDREHDIENQNMKDLVARIEREEPHLAEEVYNIDGSYCYTEYHKNGHKYVKMPNGHIHQVS